MEPTAPLTRKRRKRAHSTKCPCCCEDRGKPEKEPRRRRREDSDSKLAGEGLWQSESLPSVRVVQTSKTTPPNASEDEKAICEFDNISDRKTVNEGRILRSGRNTPVSVEVEKDKGKTISPLKKPSKIVKKPRCCSQKGKKPTKPTSKHEKRVGDRNFMPSLTSFKPVSENSFDNHAKDSTTTSSGKAKTNKKKSKVESTKFISAQLQENHIFSHQMGQTSDREAKVAKIKRKIPGQPNKKQVKRKNDNLALLRKQPAIKKKSLTVDRLKVKAFDQLKEKLEVAFDQNSLTVPQCVEFIQKITLPNLKNMFDDATSDTRKTACEEVNIEEDISSEMTESGSETRLMEKELAENMNESEAAKTLVSFKVQTTAVVSSSSPSYTQTSSTVHELSTPQERTASVSTQKSEVSSPGSCYNMNILTTSSSFGSSRLPAPSHPSKRPEFQATVSSSVVIPPVVSSATACPTPLTFQLLQVPTHGNSPSRPPDIASAHIQQAPGFLCQNPTSINKLAPTQVVSQQPGTIFPQTLNQLLYFSKLTQQQDQKAILNLNQASFLPGLQAQDQTIGKSGFVPASHTTASTSVANISVSAPASTSTTEVIFSSKLRPILPREPLVASNFVFNQSLQQNLGSTGKIVDTPTNVKQAVKRLVNERSRSTDPSTPAEVATSLPDIASTFRKNSFPQTSISEFHGKKESSSVKEEQQDCTEMANKEQAIKALLSIGGNESLSQSTSGNLDLGNRAYDTKDANELKVVFDTDKGIFKVDDVTIDPQVNSIGKESYTCNKCGKIFTSLSYLARHIKRVCPDMSHRKWKCTHCDKAFRHPFGLQQHVYTHTGERPHKCPQCPKAFYSSNDLRRHSRIHSGERPYKCKHCGKSFATTISLKTHTFIHTGEKPHRCPHCPKTFATSSKLGRHIVTHSEQRPFSCMQCPKTFNRSGDLRRHSLHVHNGKLTENVADGGQFKEKTYRCTECSDSFASCKELELHINEHTTKWIGK